MVGVSVSLEGDLGGLYALIDRIRTLPGRRLDAIGRIMRSGVIHNYESLSMGGSVNDASGRSILWSRARNRMTVAIRRAHGLGALFPILSFTGKLGSGLARGFIGGGSNTATYTPAGDVFALIRAHQVTGVPLPSRSGNFRPNFQMPLRPMVFWSSEMARQVQGLAQAEVKS